VNLDSFQPLFNKALAVRQRYLSDALLAPWFQKTPYPPVLGFGLPDGEDPVAVVTLALNPSDDEVKGGYIPASDIPDVQWRAQSDYFRRPYLTWFSKAQRILRVASQAKVSYGGALGHGYKAVHLDLTPFPTEGKFDKVFDAKATTADQRRRAVEMIRGDIAAFLLPLLGVLHQQHGVRSLLLWGYCPRDAGSRTMKQVWGRGDGFTLARTGVAGGIKWAVGEWTIGGGQKFRASFMSQGPSSRASPADLDLAAAELASNDCFAL
jgi:hypothetical protein